MENTAVTVNVKSMNFLPGCLLFFLWAVAPHQTTKHVNSDWLRVWAISRAVKYDGSLGKSGVLWLLLFSFVAPSQAFEVKKVQIFERVHLKHLVGIQTDCVTFFDWPLPRRAESCSSLVHWALHDLWFARFQPAMFLQCGKYTETKEYRCPRVCQLSSSRMRNGCFHDLQYEWVTEWMRVFYM